MENGKWSLTVDGAYTVVTGYKWLDGVISVPNFPFVSLVWNHISVPKHCFITWLMIHHKLLTRDRLRKWMGTHFEEGLVLCGLTNESHAHLFFSCAYSREVVCRISAGFGLSNLPTCSNAWKRWVLHLKHSRSMRVRTWFAVMAGLVYFLWREHNRRLFAAKSIGAEQLVGELVQTLQCKFQALSVASNARCK